MTIFLRDSNGRDLADIEVTADDVVAVVPIKGYSLLLASRLGPDKGALNELIRDFAAIQELRGWYWETFRHFNPDATQAETVGAIKGFLAPIAQKYDLRIVTD